MRAEFAIESWGKRVSEEAAGLENETIAYHCTNGRVAQIEYKPTAQSSLEFLGTNLSTPWRKKTQFHFRPQYERPLFGVQPE
jgi:hypothetical protein